MFYYYLGIDQEDDVVNCEPVEDPVLDAWIQGDGDGPILRKGQLHFDWHGGKKSAWNIKALELMAQKILDGILTMWNYLPKYDVFYFLHTIQQKFANLLTIWRSGQSRPTGPGLRDFETLDQIEERRRETKQARNLKQRHNTRRRNVSQHTLDYSIAHQCSRNIRIVFQFVKKWLIF
jgi:hypothetical protein